MLSFRLVGIPVELHTATHSQNVSFHLLHAKCVSHVRNHSLCPVCNEAVERDQLVRGKVDPVYFDATYYLAPDQGGEKAYRLLAEGAMEKSGRKRDPRFRSNCQRGNLRLTNEEMELGRGLIEKLSSETSSRKPTKDERRNRVMAMIEEKVKGREITVAPKPLPFGKV